MGDEILGRRCVTHDISTGDLARMVELEERFMAENRIAESTQSVTIPVRFIHILYGNEGVVSQAQRVEQMRVMNDAFLAATVRFTYDEDNVTEVDNATFFAMGHMSAAERQCKQLHQ